jgi:hypothetical protein
MATRIDGQPRVIPPRGHGVGDAGGVTETTEVTPTPSTANNTVDSMEGSGSSRSLGSKVKTKLTELAWDTLKSGTTQGFSVGDDAKLGVKVRGRVLRGSDNEIKNNAHRKAGTEAVRQDGKTPIWVETAGLLQPSAGLNGSLPMGTLNLAVGFRADALAEYRALRPYGDPDVSDAAKGAVKMPLDADAAKDLVEGTEIEIKGRGTARLSASLGAGASTGIGPATGNVGGRLGHSQTREANYGIKLTKLDGDKIRVNLDEIKSRSGTTTASVSAGITIDGDQVIDDHLGDSIAGLGGGKLSDLVASAGASAIEDVVKDFTAFHASVGKTAREDKLERVSYVLDLATPEGAAAYEKLLKLDEDGAEKLASQAGVTRAEYDGTRETDGTNAGVRFAGQKLVLFNALRAEEAGTLSTEDGTSLVRSSIANRSYSGIFSGKKSIRWESVDLTDASGPQRFFHMKFQKDDKLTRHGELKEFVRFADGLGIDNKVARQLDLDSTFFVRAFGGADDTKVDVDVYFTDAGVQKIAGFSRDEARAKMAEAVGIIDPDAAGAPVNDPAARQIVADYLRAKRKNRGGGNRNSRASADMSRARSKYKRQFGASLTDHLEAFRQADALGPKIAQLNNAGDNQGWTTLLTDIGASSKFDYMPSLLALSMMAGKDETLVHKLSIAGKNVKLESTDEGALRNPMTDVGDAIDRAGDS